AAPGGLRLPLLVIDAYGILIVLAIAASIVTRPHVVAADELRIRWGVFFDLRIPRAAIASVRVVRNDNERGTVKLDGDRLAVAIASRTNVVVELPRPVAGGPPLGRRGLAPAGR